MHYVLGVDNDNNITLTIINIQHSCHITMRLAFCRGCIALSQMQLLARLAQLMDSQWAVLYVAWHFESTGLNTVERRNHESGVFLTVDGVRRLGRVTSHAVDCYSTSRGGVSRLIVLFAYTSRYLDQQQTFTRAANVAADHIPRSATSIHIITIHRGRKIAWSWSNYPSLSSENIIQPADAYGLT